MWALSPSIFDLLAHRLLPSKPSVLVQYPAVQFVFLQILYSHCSRLVVIATVGIATSTVVGLPVCAVHVSSG